MWGARLPRPEALEGVEQRASALGDGVGQGLGVGLSVFSALQAWALALASAAAFASSSRPRPRPSRAWPCRWRRASGLGEAAATALRASLASCAAACSASASSAFCSCQFLSRALRPQTGQSPSPWAFVEAQGVVEEGGELVGLPRHGLRGGCWRWAASRSLTPPRRRRSGRGLEDGQALEEVDRVSASPGVVPARIASTASRPQSSFRERLGRLPARSSVTASSFARIALRSWSASFCALSRVVRACWRASARRRGRRGRGPSRGRRRASTGPRRASSRARCRRGRDGSSRGRRSSRASCGRPAACRGPAPSRRRRRARPRPPTRARRCRCPSRPRGRTRRRGRPSGGGGSSSRRARPWCASSSGRCRR